MARCGSAAFVEVSIGMQVGTLMHGVILWNGFHSIYMEF